MTHAEYQRKWRAIPENAAKQNAAHSRWQKRNRKKANATLRRWRKRTNYRSTWRAAHKLEHAAHQTVYWHVRHGKLIKPTSCSKCGKACKPQGHHKDYSKPLEVIWLCQPCHRAEHAKERPCLS